MIEVQIHTCKNGMTIRSAKLGETWYSELFWTNKNQSTNIKVQSPNLIINCGLLEKASVFC